MEKHRACQPGENGAKTVGECDVTYRLGSEGWLVRLERRWSDPVPPSFRNIRSIQERAERRDERRRRGACLQLAMGARAQGREGRVWRQGQERAGASGSSGRLPSDGGGISG